jgi:TRAP-type mannitol/chloroaromatic compound transport system permease small subunit
MKQRQQTAVAVSFEATVNGQVRGGFVQALLKLARAIDWLNERCGRVFMLLVLVAVAISAGNAIVRKLFHTSSNAFLEIQWYLFGAIFLLCSGYTLLKNEHVRIDVIVGRLSQRAQAWIDVFGGVFFLLPLCAIILYYGWPQFMKSWELQEMSADAGGLVRWPVMLLIPLGFALLTLQGVSQTIKNVAFLMGLAPFPYAKAKSAEEKLVEEIKAMAIDKEAK